VTGFYECSNGPLGSINAGNFLSSLGCVSFLGRTVLHGVSQLLIQQFVHYLNPWILCAAFFVSFSHLQTTYCSEVFLAIFVFLYIPEASECHPFPLA
jgi:hypothetical protein